MKLLFLIIIIFIFIFNEKKLIEPNFMKCCGGMVLGKDYHETDIKPPKKWSRCFDHSKWNSMPCIIEGTPECCGGDDNKCRPSKLGGKCERNDRTGTEGKHFIYNASGNKVEYDRDQEKKDLANYKEDDDDDDDDEDDEGVDDLSDIFYIICGIFVLIMGILLIYKFVSDRSKKGESIFATPPSPFTPSSSPSSAPFSSPFSSILSKSPFK